MKLSKKLFKNKAGTAAVEAAIVLPIFIYLSMLIIESSIIHYYQSAIDNALFETIRFSKVSTENRTASSFEDEVREKIRENTFGVGNPDRLVVTTDLAVDFDTEYGDPEMCENRNFAIPNVACVKTDANPLGCDEAAGFFLIDSDSDGKCDMPPPALALGESGDIVTVIAVYKWKALTPGIKYFFGTGTDSSDNRDMQNILTANNDGDHVIVTGMTYRNEE